MTKPSVLAAGGWLLTAGLGALVGGLVVHFASNPPGGAVAAGTLTRPARSPGSSGASRVPLDPAQFRQDEIRDQKALFARAEAEARDDPWATRTSQQIRDELEATKLDTPFQVGAIDCRTTMCTATIRWPGYAAAQTASPALVAPFGGPGCARVMYTLPPDDASAPYSSILVFDCRDARAGR